MFILGYLRSSGNDRASSGIICKMGVIGTATANSVDSLFWVSSLSPREEEMTGEAICHLSLCLWGVPRISAWCQRGLSCFPTAPKSNAYFFYIHLDCGSLTPLRRCCYCSIWFKTWLKDSSTAKKMHLYTMHLHYSLTLNILRRVKLDLENFLLLTDSRKHRL